MRTDCERRDSINTAIIKEYENQTGISARSTDDLVEAFQIKNDVRDQCQFELSEAVHKTKKLERQKNTLKFGLFVVSPVAFVIGVMIGNKINN